MGGVYRDVHEDIFCAIGDLIALTCDSTAFLAEKKNCRY